MAFVASLALAGLSAHAQTLTNWLVNPGFELGTTGWSIVQPWSWNGPSYAVQNTNQLVNTSPTVHVSVHGGTNAFKEWGYYQTYPIASGAMQTFAAAPGSQWSASGWVSTQVPDNIGTNTAGTSCTSYLQLLFLDATTNYNLPLASYTSPIIDHNSATSTWLPRQVVDGVETNLTAPAGTAFVRLQMLFWQPYPWGGGSSYWDDVQLLNTSRPDPQITVQPVPVEKVYGQTATFSVTADGNTALTYKWQKDGADITDPNAYGVNTSTLTLSNVTTATMGYYSVTVTDTAGPLTSDQAFLSVLDPGVLSITPALGQTKTNGDTATFTVAAAGSATPTYSWQLNNAPLSDGPRITGSGTPTLTVANLTAADAGTYTALINGGAAQASTGLKVVSASQLATNILLNAGFEDGVYSEPWESAWIKFNGGAINSTNDYYYLSATPVSVYDGNYVCRTYTSDADNGLYQNQPATAGATYHAGGQFYVSDLDPVTGLAWTVLQVMFKNAGGATIATCASPLVNPSFPLNAWTYLQVTNGAGSTDLVAPAGTVYVTCQVYEYAQQGGGGSVYFDDLYMTRASLPAPPAATITASQVGGSIELSFPSTTGVIYEVLYANSLASPASWQTNTTILGDGTVKTASDPIGATKRFYRLLEHY